MSPPEPGVSVVVPTWNRRGVLPRALESVRAQTRPALEIIVVDDGSTDGTAAFAREAFPEIRLVTQPNRGVSAARNRGLAVARGRYVAFLDSDDAWLPRKLERQLEALEREPDYPLCHSDEFWVRRGVRVNPMRKHDKRGGWIFSHCLPRCAISPSSVLAKRSLFDELGGFDESLPACEDYDLWLRVTARYPVLYLDEKLVTKYGGHQDQLSRKHWGMDRFRIRALEKILASGELSPKQREMARAVLREKAAIFAAGARKRGRVEEAEALVARHGS